MMNSRFVFCATILGLLGAMVQPADADQGAGLICPPVKFAFPSLNRAHNPSFESAGINGSTTNCPKPCTALGESAAALWAIHTDSLKSALQTQLVPTTVPFGTDPLRGTQMLHIVAGGNEGGVRQVLSLPPVNRRLMFSARIFVVRGQVQIQASDGSSGPDSLSSKTRQWEELRVCTDGSVPIDTLVIYNQNPARLGGGEFYINRAEARMIP